jgi:hypothetical protein
MPAVTAAGTVQQQAAAMAQQQAAMAAMDRMAMQQLVGAAGVLRQVTDGVLVLLAAGGMVQLLAGDGAGTGQQHMLAGMKRRAMVKKRSMMRGMGPAGTGLLLVMVLRQLRLVAL